MDAREQHIARMEGREYVPSANTDNILAVMNGAEIDAIHLASFDDWVRTNQIDTARLFGLLRNRK